MSLLFTMMSLKMRHFLELSTNISRTKTDDSMVVPQRQDQMADGMWLRMRTAFVHLFSPQCDRFSPSVCRNVQWWTWLILTRTWQQAPSWQWTPACNLLHYWHIATEHIWTQDRKFLGWTAYSEDLSLPPGLNVETPVTWKKTGWTAMCTCCLARQDSHSVQEMDSDGHMLQSFEQVERMDQN